MKDVDFSDLLIWLHWLWPEESHGCHWNNFISMEKHCEYINYSWNRSSCARSDWNGAWAVPPGVCRVLPGFGEGKILVQEGWEGNESIQSWETAQVWWSVVLDISSVLWITITGWFGLEGIIKDQLVQPPCSKQGRFLLDQVAQSPVQPDLECSQGWGIDHLSEQAVARVSPNNPDGVIVYTRSSK